jgi:hypothetical protein
MAVSPKAGNLLNKSIGLRRKDSNVQKSGKDWEVRLDEEKKAAKKLPLSKTAKRIRELLNCFEKN